jgi:hypothetical protein
MSTLDKVTRNGGVMNHAEAVQTIKDLIRSETQLMKEFTSPRGRITKKTNEQQKRAARKLFAALVGCSATIAEEMEMLGD